MYFLQKYFEIPMVNFENIKPNGRTNTNYGLMDKKYFT